MGVCKCDYPETRATILFVFADEPTSRLDPVTQKDTFRCLLEELKAAGCALLLVTHDKALAKKTVQRTLTLEALPQPG